MLIYYVEWHMREKLEPMLFDDEFIERGPCHPAFTGRQR